jgi:hypothetical protein
MRAFLTQLPHLPMGRQKPSDGQHMNQIIYIVGFVVIVLIILALLGLR